MMSTTHMAGGFAAGLAAVTLTKGTVSPIVIPISTMAALIPDIDHKNSKISKKLPFISFLVRLFNGHRGLCHTVFLYAALAAAGFPWYSKTEWGTTLVFAVLLGIFSHLLLDACTRQGVPLLFPLTRKNISILHIRTNSTGEKVVFACLICLIGVMGWRLLPVLF